MPFAEASARQSETLPGSPEILIPGDTTRHSENRFAPRILIVIATFLQ